MEKGALKGGPRPGVGGSLSVIRVPIVINHFTIGECAGREIKDGASGQAAQKIEEAEKKESPEGLFCPQDQKGPLRDNTGDCVYAFHSSDSPSPPLFIRHLFITSFSYSHLRRACFYGTENVTFYSFYRSHPGDFDS